MTKAYGHCSCVQIPCKLRETHSSNSSSMRIILSKCTWRACCKLVSSSVHLLLHAESTRWSSPTTMSLSTTNDCRNSSTCALRCSIVACKAKRGFVHGRCEYTNMQSCNGCAPELAKKAMELSDVCGRSICKRSSPTKVTFLSPAFHSPELADPACSEHDEMRHC
jgi:hypothetical protein